MKSAKFIILFLLLAGSTHAATWPYTPLELPHSRFGGSNEWYAFDLRPTLAHEVNLQSHYVFDNSYVIIDLPGTVYPTMEMDEGKLLVEWGKGFDLWYTHGSTRGLAVSVFKYSAEGQAACQAYYDFLISEDPTYNTSNIYLGDVQNVGFHVSMTWEAFRTWRNSANGIDLLMTCYSFNGNGINAGGAAASLGLDGEVYDADVVTIVDEFTKYLSRQKDGEDYWTGAAASHFNKLKVFSESSNATVWPSVKQIDKMPGGFIWVPPSTVTTFEVEFDCKMDLSSHRVNYEGDLIAISNWRSSSLLDITLMPIPFELVDGGGRISLDNTSFHAPGEEGLHIEGDYWAYCFISTNPAATVNNFSVDGGTGTFRVSGERNVTDYIVTGSDSDQGPWQDVTRIPATGASEYTFAAASYSYYQLQHEEVNPNTNTQVTRSHGIVPAGLWMRTNTAPSFTEEELKQVLQRHRQELIATEGRAEKLDDATKTLPDLTIHVITPTRFMGAMDDLEWTWETAPNQNVAVEIHYNDDFWAGTTDPDVFLANEKAYLAALPNDTPLLIMKLGTAMLENEFNTPWPEEFGWRTLQQGYLSDGLVADHNLNLNPTPSRPDPRPERIGHGGFGPYWYSDWLQLDFDGDNWPDPGYAICRLPFEDITQVMYYIDKLMAYTSSRFVPTHFPTVQWVLGDRHHQNDYDGLEAIQIVEKLQQTFDHWTNNPAHPPLLESDYPSDPGRSQKTLEVMNENWASMIVGTSSMSNRYYLGNFWFKQYMDLGELALGNNISLPIMSMFTCDFAHYGWPRSPHLGSPFNSDLLGVYQGGPIAVVGPNDWSHQLSNGEFAELYLGELSKGKRLAFAVADALQEYRQQHPDDEYRMINALKTTVLGDGAIEMRVRDSNLSGVGNAPATSVLANNYPNPFNPKTTIHYNTPSDGHVKISVYDARGQLVTTLVDEYQLAGRYLSNWNGTDQSGHRVSSGVYLYRLTAAGKTITQKMTLLK